MSLRNSIRIPIPWPNVDVFTFGQSSLYGYDCLNHCLVTHSIVELNNISTDHLHLSSSPARPIQRLILNEDETILALLADRIAYLVYLPKSHIPTDQNSSAKGSHLCPIIRVPPSLSSSTSINCSLIDFLWLTSKHFVIVNSIPSSSECHLYTIRSLKEGGIEYIRAFSVGYSSSNMKYGTPNKKISLHQPSDIIKLDKSKREDENIESILLFAMKTDGDIFILEINANEFLSDNTILGEFQGPVRILPSTFDNYGADHGQSTFISLSNNLLVFTRDKCQLNQCILLSPRENHYSLFTIDSIFLPTNQSGEILKTILKDPFSSNRYFLSDSKSNVYSIEISWIEQIQQGTKQLQSTRLQHLINGMNSNQKINNQIEQISVIQTDHHGQYLAVIVQSLINQQKELILIHLQSNEISSSTVLQSEFVDRIRSLLSRDQSIPYVSLSTSSTNISESDFEKNLSQFIQIFSGEYIEKQEKVRREIENKQRYLADFHQTQLNEYKQLNQKFQQIQKQFQILKEQYQQECSRRQRLSTHINDLLSVIEQSTPILSDAEMRMRQQLETYQVQIEIFKEKAQLLQQFISSNQNEAQKENLRLENVHNYVSDHRNQIDQMKTRLQTIQNNK